MGQDDEKRFTGNYLAKVKDNKDPEKLGRVKLTCNEIWGKDLISWWVPVKPGAGTANVPPVGKLVNLEFESADPDRPRYTGVHDAAPGNKSEVNDAAKGDANHPNKSAIIVSKAGGGSSDGPDNPYGAKYPSNKAQVTPGGHTIEYDDTPGKERVNIQHKSGAFVEMHPDGKIVIKGNNDVYIGANSSVNLKGSSDINIEGPAGTSIKSGGSSNTQCANRTDQTSGTSAEVANKKSITAPGGIDMNNGTQGAARRLDTVQVYDPEEGDIFGFILTASGTSKIGD